MDLTLTPDNIIYWQWSFIKINATLVYSWLVMALLVLGSWLVTRRLSTGRQISRWQSLLEMLVLTINEQIEQVSRQDPRPYLPFIGTLFLFISLANFLSIVPGYHPPTASLSTTAALALCVFVAVPLYGIRQQGLWGYLKHYIEPSPILLPFHIISEISRTVALAVRLFGNVMSGTLLVAILLAIVPFFLPVLLEGLELLVGQIQAYIFAVLAMVFIASAARVQEEDREEAAEDEASP